MDCQTVKEKINLYIDGMLSSAESLQLVMHAESCPECKKELDDKLRLKKALSALGELEPPEGLAAGAVRRARKRRGVPIAYISVGVAAALALVVILTTGVLPQKANDAERISTESMMMAAPAEDAQSGTGSAFGGTSATEAPMSVEDQAPKLASVPEPASQEPASPSVESSMSAESTAEAGDMMQENMVAMGAPEPDCIVYVSADRETDVKAALESIIAEHNIKASFLSDDAMDTYSFVLPEDALEELTALTADLEPEGEVAADKLIEFRFIK